MSTLYGREGGAGGRARRVERSGAVVSMAQRRRRELTETARPGGAPRAHDVLRLAGYSAMSHRCVTAAAPAR